MRPAQVTTINILILADNWIVCPSLFLKHPSTWAESVFLRFPLTLAALLAKFTCWRTPGMWHRATRRSRRSRPRTGARIHYCRRSVLKAGWRSWEGAWSHWRHGFDPGNRERPSGAPCCCCCPCGCGQDGEKCLWAEERIPNYDTQHCPGVCFH